MDVDIGSVFFPVLRELIKSMFHRYLECFILIFYFWKEYWEFETNIANLTREEEPYAKMPLELRFFMKSYADVLDSRLRTRSITPSRDGSTFRLDNHLKL